MVFLNAQGFIKVLLCASPQSSYTILEAEFDVLTLNEESEAQRGNQKTSDRAFVQLHQLDSFVVI